MQKRGRILHSTTSEIRGYYIQQKLQSREGDVEIDPFWASGKEYRVFLTPVATFRALVGEVSVFAESYTKVGQKIISCLESKHGDELLFFPIIRIDADSDNGFGLTRGWFAENPNDKMIYSCGWHVPPETRMNVMTPDPYGLPVSISKLPFIDTPEDGWVYYGLFQERLWMAFMKLNDTLSCTLARNKNDIISYISNLDANAEYRKDIYDLLYRRMLTP